jgi:8-amino-7-oxononanoate synthase
MSRPQSHLTSPLEESLAADLATLDRAGLRRFLAPIARRRGAEVLVEGRPAVDFSSNDYLGIASDPRVDRAAIDALDDEAFGGAAARLISGNHPLHEQLEREIASLKGTEASLLFGSGYLANIGALPCLTGSRDVIYADELNHASLIDACRLSRAEVRTYPHNDLKALRGMLHSEPRARRRLIVADGVFSMDGDILPLDEILPIAREVGAALYVDDAHATGVLGENGRGTAEHFGLDGEIDVTMGTLGKALGTVGAFVAGSDTLRSYLMNRARSFVFTTATPPALAAAAIAGISIARQEPERRTRLMENSTRLAAGLRAIGCSLSHDLAGHIIPIPIGDAGRTVAIGGALRSEGFLVGAVRPPTVPLGGSRLRITLSAAHTEEQIDGLLSALERHLTNTGVKTSKQ